ncbi:hypothetical protein TNCV_3780101 [Trichonephila clavipes]|nr:hypothetical protein TNCV_3780101 [Trichonephila clavipes]
MGARIQGYDLGMDAGFPHLFDWPDPLEELDGARVARFEEALEGSQAPRRPQGLSNLPAVLLRGDSRIFLPLPLDKKGGGLSALPRLASAVMRVGLRRSMAPEAHSVKRVLPSPFTECTTGTVIQLRKGGDLS